jgi:mannose-6-phosphate isomerase-like protein (cupin superfamily)
MSFVYPPPRYHGVTGEISATFRPADSPADIGPAPDGTALHYLSTTASTGGEFGLYRYDMGPRCGGPATHFHRTISESFFVLSGTVRVYDGARWRDAGPGDHLYVPPGGLHAFRNDADAPAAMLLLFAPGAPREGYFETLASGGPTPDGRAEFLARHDNVFVE